MRDCRVLAPIASDPVVRIGVYESMIKHAGENDKAIETFKREPWYLTAAKKEKEILGNGQCIFQK